MARSTGGRRIGEGTDGRPAAGPHGGGGGLSSGGTGPDHRNGRVAAASQADGTRAARTRRVGRRGTVYEARLASMVRSYKVSMAKALVVVESPAKAKTINKYLGRN